MGRIGALWISKCASVCVCLCVWLQSNGLKAVGLARVCWNLSMLWEEEKMGIQREIFRLTRKFNAQDLEMFEQNTIRHFFHRPHEENEEWAKDGSIRHYHHYYYYKTHSFKYNVSWRPDKHIVHWTLNIALCNCCSYLSKRFRGNVTIEPKETNFVSSISLILYLGCSYFFFVCNTIQRQQL